MSDKSPNYSTILDREADRIINDLGEARSLFKHNPSLGSAIEQTVSCLIGKFLPNVYEVTSGFAVDSMGKLSPQQDILIVKRHKIGPLSTYAGFGVYPIEQVLAAIEVKTSLTVAELISAMKTLEEFAVLSPGIPGESTISKEPGNLLQAKIPVCAPFTAIFALETEIAIGRILHEVQTHNSNSVIKTRLNAVHILDQSVTCWVDKNGATYPSLTIDPQSLNVQGINFDWEGRQIELATAETNANESLKAFLGLLLSFLSWYRPPPLDLQKYLLTDLKLNFDVEPKLPSN